MPTSDQYRKIADKYYRFAREARTETDRLALLDLAETWQQRASPQNEMTPEQIAQGPERSQTKTFFEWWQRVLRLFASLSR